MKKILSRILIVCLFLVSCNGIDNQSESSEECSWSWAEDFVEYGEVVNNSSMDVDLSFYCFENAANRKSPKGMNTIVKSGETVKLEWYIPSGDVPGYYPEIKIGNWSACGYFCEKMDRKCTHDLDGFYYSRNGSFSDLKKDIETGTLIPLTEMDGDLVFTVTNEGVSVGFKKM